MSAILTGSMCAGSVHYWAVALAMGHVWIETDERHLPLRHSHHRYRIAGPNGVQTLTVPLVGESHTMATPMSEVRISEHGNWRRLHWGAIFSAYGRSPYFDFVADELEPIIMGEQTHLLDFNRAMQQLIVSFLDFPITFEYGMAAHVPTTVHLRRWCEGKRHQPAQPATAVVPYYQVWQHRHGFLPDLSILDLLMNMGRESIYILRKMSGMN
ncbi:MAG: WbqC family protein [Muribaculaceae bacterium]|nr:WbqC family protein [Muribaculaceae bacterium]